MIPKIIHYCWFGGNPLPTLAIKCIESWKKYFPDYEIKEWNEDNFNVNIIPYTKEAYHAKKYAFVSDYARFWILYKYGGLYFDTDVEIIKPMEEIVARGPFMGCENDASDTNVVNVALSLGVNPGLGLGITPGSNLYKEILDLYSTLHFRREDGSYNLKTIVQYTTETLCTYGLKNINEIQECAGIWIYPKEYFCPKDFETKILNVTDRTFTIHHFDGSWVSEESRYAHQIRNEMLWLPNKRLRGYIASFYSKVRFQGIGSACGAFLNWLRRKV